MFIWSVYASVLDNEIKNISVFEPDKYHLANMIAKDEYGQNAIAVEVTQYAVKIGDKYIDGKFYDGVNETEITATPTERESIQSLTGQTENLNEAVDDIIIELLGG